MLWDVISLLEEVVSSKKLGFESFEDSQRIKKL